MLLSCVTFAQSHLFNSKSRPYPFVKLAPAWKELEERGVPDVSFSGSEFYILGRDGQTPAAKVLVLAGQGDTIDPSKMEQNLDPSIKILPFDRAVDPKALRVLFKGREPSAATMWVVPPVSTLGRSPQRAACTHRLGTVAIGAAVLVG